MNKYDVTEEDVRSFCKVLTQQPRYMAAFVETINSLTPPVAKRAFNEIIKRIAREDKHD